MPKNDFDLSAKTKWEGKKKNTRFYLAAQLIYIINEIAFYRPATPFIAAHAHRNGSRLVLCAFN